MISKKLLIQALKYHWESSIQVFTTLKTGKFLLYFLPGLVIGAIYLVFYFQIHELLERSNSTEDQSWIGSAFSWITSQAFGILDILVFEFYKFFILVILSPVNNILSEKYDTHLTGKAFSFSFLRLVNDFIRMIFLVAAALFLEYLFLVIWWFLSWVLPDFIGETLFFFISAFFLGFSFYDYSLERYQLGFFRSWNFGFTKLSYVLVTGTLFSLIFKIPYLGVIISPVLITMIATGVFIKLQQNKLRQQQNT